MRLLMLNLGSFGCLNIAVIIYIYNYIDEKPKDEDYKVFWVTLYLHPVFWGLLTVINVF
jgi:hypothetical protein